MTSCESFGCPGYGISHWLWDSGPEWFSMPHGWMIILGGMLGLVLVVEVVQKIRRRDSVFF